MDNDNLNIIEQAKHALEHEKIKLHGVTELIRSNEYIVKCLNDNKTKTLYVFTAPLEFKGAAMRRDETGYFKEGEFFDIRLPYVWSRNSGIKVGEDIRIFPVSEELYNAYQDEKANIFGQNKKCVIYKNFYDPNTDFCCYTTGFGVNMEIIIRQYTENNIFKLKLKQPVKDIFAVADSPDYILFRTENEFKSVIYTPLAVDAENHRSYKNYVELRKDETDNSYIVSYVIDKEFLNDPKTKYPVTLNQSIYGYKRKQSDTAMYSKTGDTVTHHLSPYMFLGDNTSKGEGWGFVRFEELYEVDIPEDKIISAEYCFNNLFDNEEHVTIGAFAVTNDWCSVNTRWNSKPGYDKVPVKTVDIKERGIYSLDITRLFIEMMKGKKFYEPLYSLRNSFCIKSITKGSNLVIASGDSGIFSPYLKIVIKD